VLTVAGNLVNALLDAIFIFPLGLGVSGAALATVTSEYLTAFILLWKLNSKIVLFSWNIVSGDIIRYLKSGWSIFLMLISKDYKWWSCFVRKR
jgi:Na+-driven multidrug efflux pump